MSLYAITVAPEWAWAIVTFGKDVELRHYRPWRELIGQQIAIHAGHRLGGHRRRMARYNLKCFLKILQDVAGARPDDWADQARALSGRIVALTQLGPPVRSRLHPSPWAAYPLLGHWAWPLSDVRRTNSPQVRGMPGFWPVPQAILPQLEVPC